MFLHLFFLIAKKPAGQKPKAPEPRSPERRLTQEEQQEPSGIDLVNVDYPEDENFEQDLNADEIIEGLNWFAQFQVQVMKRRRKREGHNNVFIRKLDSEMKQTKVVIYREFAKK